MKKAVIPLLSLLLLLPISPASALAPGTGINFNDTVIIDNIDPPLELIRHEYPGHVSFDMIDLSGNGLNASEMEVYHNGKKVSVAMTSRVGNRILHIEYNPPFENQSQMRMTVLGRNNFASWRDMFYTIDATSDVLYDLKGHWAETSIRKLLDAKIMTGYLDHKFRPDEPMKRVEMVKFLELAKYKSEILNAVNSASRFSDVGPYEWYSRYIVFGDQKGFVNGYSDGTFRPAANINRAEAIAMLARVYYPDAFTYSKTASFPDVPGNAWYAEIVAYLKDNDVVHGDADGRFHPDRALSRAELAKLLTTVMKL